MARGTKKDQIVLEEQTEKTGEELTKKVEKISKEEKAEKPKEPEKPKFDINKSEYPAYRYHKEHGQRLVNNAQEDKALGGGWRHTPQDF